MSETVPAGKLHAAVEKTVAQWRDRLVAASHDLHDHPETAFAEHRSAGVVAGVLRDAGFRTEVGVYGLDTAIEAVRGEGSMTVVVCAEYDALPNIGHACGHNIIATAGVGAAIALAELAGELDLTVKLLGTPAEERGGGKALLLEAGAWEDATISVMVHPGPGGAFRSRGLTSQGRDGFRIEYTGKASHAAVAPHLGVNAGNAATLLHVALGLLRQQVPDGVRMGAVTLNAGDVANVIPATAALEGEVRSTDADVLRDVKDRYLACVHAAAMATGCGVRVTPIDPVYQPLVQHPFLADRYDEALERRGRTILERPGAVGGSTDMGNVSQVVPSIHPGIGIPGSKAMPHTTEFAAATATPAADDAIVDAAYALACAVADLAADADARGEVIAAQQARPAGATRVPAYPPQNTPEAP
ncbi:amidohydrolase [Amycolatopsis bartoniae]|uniref:Peptidase M20 domain-containing protein 2 n=1 Tax=Amycolatopsis bartoniae TaxID=941986 RepID=A0A8H9IN06_9PSEU|nr:M20 family metallopeptidase [Amycolatopsis bartoniae]MBB2940148.1 amidohydrolase [Amycolatopsis bartoniae]TVT06252.1 M20 family metallopeptidase [Amycolatopsis bartoniae]GHF36856.1 amidase [Amycolatopsis bartoniae]